MTKSYKYIAIMGLAFILLAFGYLAIFQKPEVWGTLEQILCIVLPSIFYSVVAFGILPAEIRINEEDWDFDDKMEHRFNEIIKKEHELLNFRKGYLMALEKYGSYSLTSKEYQL